MKTVIRITRHPVESGRTVALQKAFGSDVNIVDCDIPYGDNPVQAVVALLGEYTDLVAVEVVAPVPVLAKLVQAKRELGHVKIIRAEFARGDDGRALVVGQDSAGRDIFGFSHYEVMKEVRVVTEPLLS